MTTKSKPKYLIVKFDPKTGNFHKMVGKGGLVGGFNNYKNAVSMLNGYLKKYYPHNKYKIIMGVNYAEGN